MNHYKNLHFRRIHYICRMKFTVTTASVRQQHQPQPKSGMEEDWG